VCLWAPATRCTSSRCRQNNSNSSRGDPAPGAGSNSHPTSTSQKAHLHHVLQVIIEGFTSYKDQLIADPFSPKINVIGGSGGAGSTHVGCKHFSQLNNRLLHMQLAPTAPASPISSKVRFESHSSSSTAERAVKLTLLSCDCSYKVCTQRCFHWSRPRGASEAAPCKLLAPQLSSRLSHDGHVLACTRVRHLHV